jgi:CheY-like chemotaxis protein
MPHRNLAADILSYAGSGGVVAGGGLFASAQSPDQGFYGLLISIIGFCTLALPQVGKELERRRDERGLARRAAEAERRADEAERKATDAEAKAIALAAEVGNLRTHHVQPNTVGIAVLGVEFTKLRQELVRAGYIRSSASTDSLTTVKPALLVEDDADTAARLAEVLASAYYDVELAQTLAAALEALPKRPCGLVLLDLGLPDGDGLDVIKAARRQQLDCRFVVTTGYSDDARLDRVRSYLTERDRLLVKPVHFHDLMAAILPPPESPR